MDFYTEYFFSCEAALEAEMMSIDQRFSVENIHQRKTYARSLTSRGIKSLVDGLVSEYSLFHKAVSVKPN